MIDQVYGLVAGVIQKGQDLAVIEKRELFLADLRKSGYQVLMEKKRSDEMLHFLRENILFYDGKLVFPRNKVYQSAISEYLDNYVKK